ncbi:hypothetical protein ACM26V_14635 [Salipaludibacillus sp. HK11]|uniref:DUF4129 domain-containing protein n=1 Tax=Salipaludibacillus sp. HK11 TaxID=3394320 RepID=UPI0039FC99EE
MERKPFLTLLYKWFLGMLEALVALPIVVFLWTQLIGEGDFYTWLSVILFTFIVGLLLYEWKPNKNRWFYYILAVFVSIGVAFVLTSSMIPLVFTGILVLIMLVRGVRYGKEPVGDPFNEFYLLGGIIGYFFAFFFYREMENLIPFQTLITWSGVAIILFTLFYANQEYLRGATLSKTRKPYIEKIVRVRNQLAVAIIIGLAFLITSAQYVEAFFSRVFAFIGSLISVSSSDEPPPASPDMDMAPPDLGPLTDEPSEPSRFLQIFETILMYTVGVIAGVGVIVLILLVFKIFRKQISRLWGWLAGTITKFGGESEKEEEPPYVDEKISLRDWADWRKKNKDKVKDWVSAPFTKAPTMDDYTTRNEKIRFLYRHSLRTEIKNGYEFRKNATPSETLRELVAEDRNLTDLSETELADVYAKVRYGDHTGDITEGEFNRVFRQ